MSRFESKNKFAVLAVSLMFLLIGSNFVLRLNYSPANLDWQQLRYISNGFGFIAIGLFFLGSAIVIHMWGYRKKKTMKKLLTWHLVMLKFWFLTSGIIFLVGGYLLRKLDAFHSVLNFAIGWCFLVLFIVLQLCVKFPKKKNNDG